MSQAAVSGKAPRERRGAFMSTKQIAEAAYRGRKVTFRFVSGMSGEEVTGYVVGMDDYHWMVAIAVPTDNDDPIRIVLVHKSADLITLSGKSTFDSEPSNVQEALSRVGGAFWEHCKNNR